MLFHAIWYQQRFYLWCEPRTQGHDGLAGGNGALSSTLQSAGAPSTSLAISLATSTFATTEPITTDDAPPATLHRHALPAQELRGLLGEMLSDGLLANVGQEAQLSLWLPGDDAGTWQADDTRPMTVLDLRRTLVPALSFSPAEAVDLLRSLPESVLAEGGSIAYWAKLAHLVYSRLENRQFFPELLHDGGALRGEWRLSFSNEDDAILLHRYAETMPSVCRSMDDKDDRAIDAALLVETFLSATADALIRREVADDSFFARPGEQATLPLAPPEVKWLAGLLGTSPSFRMDDRDLFVEQVRSWLGRLDEGRSRAPARLCFELVEPVIEDEPDPVDALMSSLAAKADMDEVDDAESMEPELADDAAVIDEPADASADALATRQMLDEADRVVWTLELSLEVEGADETVVSAADIWAEPAGGGILSRGVLHRRAQLMAELARASAVCPLLERVQKDAEPSEMEMSTLEANVFIRQWAGVLAEQGFGIKLPSWATRREQELGLMLDARPISPLEEELLADKAGGRSRTAPEDGLAISTGGMGLHYLLDFDWRIALGDMQLTVHDFERLVNRGTPLVRFRGKWTQIDPDAAKRALEYLQKRPSGRMTLAEAFRTAYGASRGESGLPVLGLSGVDWMDSLLKQAPPMQADVAEQPVGFKGTMRPYQLRGLQWMQFLDRLGLGACLADDMGLGKTIQLIALLQQERANAKTPIGPTLLFAPTSVVSNWTHELARFAPELKPMVHHGPQRLAGDAFIEAAKAHDIVITSYALAHRDAEDLQRVPWHRLALDEAQKIKNPSAASTVAIRSLNAMHRVALTGTPIENHLSELWSIMELLNPGLLGTAGEFRERFALPIEKLQDKDRAQQLKAMIRPFLLRRTKSDPAIAGDLPEKLETRVFCNLTGEQAALYERVTADMLNQIDAATGIRRRGLILAALTRLKQICDHPALLARDTALLDGRSGKCERLMELLEEVIEEGDGALIFTQYREMGLILEKLITQRLKVNSQFLHGGTSAKGRDEMIQRFQKPGSDVKIFILSLRAGGLGLNLTAANHVFHFDRWWNPAVESQATDRAYRIGQTRKVQVHKFVCVGTMEERIDRMLTEKLALADRIVTTGDEWLTNLSTDELRGYLQLTSDAVGDFQES